MLRTTGLPRSSAWARMCSSFKQAVVARHERVVDDDLHVLACEPAELIEIAEAVEEGADPGIAAASGVRRFRIPERLARHGLVANAAIVSERRVGSAQPVFGERLIRGGLVPHRPATLRHSAIMVIRESIGVAGILSEVGGMQDRLIAVAAETTAQSASASPTEPGARSLVSGNSFRMNAAYILKSRPKSAAS